MREAKWCKGDLCDALGVRSNRDVLDTQTIGAGIIFIKKCDESLKLVNSWLDVYKNNFNLIQPVSMTNHKIGRYLPVRHNRRKRNK